MICNHRLDSNRIKSESKRIRMKNHRNRNEKVDNDRVNDRRRWPFFFVLAFSSFSLLLLLMSLLLSSLRGRSCSWSSFLQKRIDCLLLCLEVDDKFLFADVDVDGSVNVDFDVDVHVVVVVVVFMIDIVFVLRGRERIVLGAVLVVEEIGLEVRSDGSRSGSDSDEDAHAHEDWLRILGVVAFVVDDEDDDEEEEDDDEDEGGDENEDEGRLGVDADADLIVVVVVVVPFVDVVDTPPSAFDNDTDDDKGDFLETKRFGPDSAPAPAAAIDFDSSTLTAPVTTMLRGLEEDDDGDDDDNGDNENTHDRRRGT
ncbi:hypothetical protein VTN77DRAFT_8725 [Rasamsonia byssochlamydoides]|uniref:uncharacterized protein n=1 Tax=Rasamsonia byssochlamydoides TaxID=89139 RepID=UPI003742B34F